MNRSAAMPSPAPGVAEVRRPVRAGTGPRHDEEVARTLRFLRKSTWLAVGGVAAGNVAPALVILVARAFPPDVFGLYVSLQLLVLTVSKLATFGLDRGLVWYVALEQRQTERNYRALASATWLALIASALIVVAATILALEEGGDNAMFTLACFLALPSWCVLHLHAGVLEGLLEPGYRIFLNQGLVTALAPAGALALHALGVGRFALPLGLIAANVTGALIIVRAARRKLPGLSYRARLSLDRALLAYSWPLGLMDVVAGVRMRADLWMVLALAGPLPAGVYAVMSTLPSGVRVIRQNYDPVVISAVTAMGAERGPQIGRVFSYAVHKVASLQLAIAVVVLLFPNELLSLAGRKYVLEPHALAVLLVAHLIQGFVGMPGSVVLGYGKSRALLLFNVAAMLLSLGLNAAWIPRLGILGAALASASTALCTSIAMLALQVRLTRSWLYAGHLWTDTVLLLGFVACVFVYQARLLELSLLERAVVAAAAGALVLLNLWLKRTRPPAPEDAPS